MKCVACLQGFDWECREEGNCDPSSNSNSNDSNTSLGFQQVEPGQVGETDGVHSSSADSSGVGSGVSDLRSDEQEEEEEEFRTYKDDSTLRDQQSTGRKRAARMYPLDSQELCEWAMKKNVGGGRYPITGCLSNLQQARHHGPEKNTLNNDKGNVHRICHTCHNRWHTANDDDYVWTDVQNPHFPVEATIQDIAESEEMWATRAVKKAKD